MILGKIVCVTDARVTRICGKSRRNCSRVSLWSKLVGRRYRGLHAGGHLPFTSVGNREHLRDDGIEEDRFQHSLTFIASISCCKKNSNSRESECCVEKMLKLFGRKGRSNWRSESNGVVIRYTTVSLTCAPRSTAKRASLCSRRRLCWPISRCCLAAMLSSSLSTSTAPPPPTGN